MISMRIKMFALNSMEKKCMNKTQVKTLYIKGFRYSKRIINTVLIPNRIINNGRNGQILAVVFICRYRFCCTHIFIYVRTVSKNDI